MASCNVNREVNNFRLKRETNVGRGDRRRFVSELWGYVSTGDVYLLKLVPGIKHESERETC